MDAAKSLDLKARAGGVAVAACGAYLLKIGFFDVLRDAEAGAAHVRSPLPGSSAVPLKNRSVPPSMPRASPRTVEGWRPTCGTIRW